MALIILPLKSYGDVDPESVVATSLKAYLPETAPKALLALGGSLELFWIWCLVLVAIGFAAANPKKIKPEQFWNCLWIVGGVGVCEGGLGGVVAEHTDTIVLSGMTNRLARRSLGRAQARPYNEYDKACAPGQAGAQQCCAVQR